MNHRNWHHLRRLDKRRDTKLLRLMQKHNLLELRNSLYVIQGWNQRRRALNSIAHEPKEPA